MLNSNTTAKNATHRSLWRNLSGEVLNQGMCLHIKYYEKRNAKKVSGFTALLRNADTSVCCGSVLEYSNEGQNNFCAK